jgi:tRNA threonylcarbamoyladenosine biosynthesis protein TsaB
MKLLAIETATRQLGVAVLDGERLVSSYELLADNPHAAELPDAVARTLDAAGLKMRDLEAVAVDIGPGSFTGLRIGLAFVKAITFGAQQAVLGVSSLDVLAAQLPFHEGVVVPILDAKRENIYGARYQLKTGNPVKQTDYLLGPVEELLETSKEPIVCLGDGCPLYRDRILAVCPQAQFAGPELWLPRAATLGRLGLERLGQGQKDDPGSLVPMYLYPQTCQIRQSERLPAAPRTKAPKTAPQAA